MSSPWKRKLKDFPQSRSFFLVRIAKNNDRNSPQNRRGGDTIISRFVIKQLPAIDTATCINNFFGGCSESVARRGQQIYENGLKRYQHCSNVD
jgi:hypothetical protein